MLNSMVLALALVYQPAPPDPFYVQAELQGLYDEISEANLALATEPDAGLFRSVVYTPDWVFEDATGQKRTWAQMCDQWRGAPSSVLPESMIQHIEKLSLAPGRAMAVVTVTAFRTIIDAQGRYGPPGASHIITETSTCLDSWVRVGDKWRQERRQQLGRTVLAVDKREW